MNQGTQHNTPKPQLDRKGNRKHPKAIWTGPYWTGTKAINWQMVLHETWQAHSMEHHHLSEKATTEWEKYLYQVDIQRTQIIKHKENK